MQVLNSNGYNPEISQKRIDDGNYDNEDVFCVGHYNFTSGNIEKAINICKKFPNDANITYLLGNCYVSIKDYEKMEKYYLMALDFDNNARGPKNALEQYYKTKKNH